MLGIVHKPERWKQPGLTDLKWFLLPIAFHKTHGKVTRRRHAHYVDNSKLPIECVNIVCDVSDPVFAHWRLGLAPAPPCDAARISSIHAWLDEKQLSSPGELLNKLYGPSTNQQIWPELDLTLGLWKGQHQHQHQLQLLYWKHNETSIEISNGMAFQKCQASTVLCFHSNRREVSTGRTTVK